MCHHIRLDKRQIFHAVSSLQVLDCPPTKSVLEVSSPFNFNLQGLSIECRTGMAYETRWILEQSLPLLCIISLYLLHTVRYSCGREAGTGWGGRIFSSSRSPTASSTLKQWALQSLAVLNPFYLTMVTNTVKVFDCIDFGEESVLASEPSIHCDAARDPVYRNLFSLSTVFMILHVVDTFCSKQRCVDKHQKYRR
jgi:hypothetical protein